MYEDNLATKPLLPCNLLSALSPTPFFSFAIWVDGLESILQLL